MSLRVSPVQSVGGWPGEVAYTHSGYTTHTGAHKKTKKDKNWQLKNKSISVGCFLFLCVHLLSFNTLLFNQVKKNAHPAILVYKKDFVCTMRLEINFAQPHLIYMQFQCSYRQQ